MTMHIVTLRERLRACSWSCRTGSYFRIISRQSQIQSHSKRSRSVLSEIEEDRHADTDAGQMDGAIVRNLGAILRRYNIDVQ